MAFWRARSRLAVARWAALLLAMMAHRDADNDAAGLAVGGVDDVDDAPFVPHAARQSRPRRATPATAADWARSIALICRRRRARGDACAPNSGADATRLTPRHAGKARFSAPASSRRCGERGGWRVRPRAERRMAWRETPRRACRPAPSASARCDGHCHASGQVRPIPHASPFCGAALAYCRHPRKGAVLRFAPVTAAHGPFGWRRREWSRPPKE